MKIIKKMTTFIILVFILCGAVSPARANNTPTIELDCMGAALMEFETGKILFEQNANEELYPASLTKIMTAMLALELGNLSDEVTASETAVTQGLSMYGSTLGIKAGETMTLESLIYSTLVSSANEACNIIAEHISGSIGDFVDLMNQRAQSLGCKNTHFVNPHGLHEQDHVSSAADMAAITYAAMQIPKFAEISNTKSIKIPATNMSDERMLYTTNYLISNEQVSGYFYKYAAGIKTGFTTPAGHCLVSSADNGTQHLLGIVMGAQSTPLEDGSQKVESFSQMKALFEWGFSAFSVQDVIDKTLPVAQVDVKYGSNTGFVLVYPAQKFSMLLPKNFEPSQFTTRVHIYNEGMIEAPISRGDVLGYMDIYQNGEQCGRVDLLALTDVERSGLEVAAEGVKGVISNRWFKLFLIAVPIVLVLYVFYMIYYNAARRRKRASGQYTGDSRSRRRHSRNR